VLGSALCSDLIPQLAVLAAVAVAVILSYHVLTDPMFNWLSR